MNADHVHATAKVQGRQDADVVMAAIEKGGRCMSPVEAGMHVSEAVNTILGCLVERDFDKAATDRLDSFAERIGELLWWHAVGRVLNREETFSLVQRALLQGLSVNHAVEACHGQG